MSFKLNVVKDNFLKRCKVGLSLQHAMEAYMIKHFLHNRLTDSGEAVSLTRRLPYTPQGILLVLISVRGWADRSATRRIKPPTLPRTVSSGSGYTDWYLALTLHLITICMFWTMRHATSPTHAYEHTLLLFSNESEVISPTSIENARNGMTSNDKMFVQTWKEFHTRTRVRKAPPGNAFVEYQRPPLHVYLIWRSSKIQYQPFLSWIVCKTPLHNCPAIFLSMELKNQS
jgi:hypothetical protein